jgi:hypothetical protein
MFLIRHLNFSSDMAIELIRKKRSADALFNPEFTHALHQEVTADTSRKTISL